MSRSPPPPVDALLVNSAFVKAVARAVLGADDRVEDVVQETWMVALRTGPDHPGALRAWLGRVARNLALRVRRQDVARRRREHAAARPESPPSASLPPVSLPPVDALLEQERVRRRLVDAVLALEEPYRTTLLLRYHQGLSAREVATLLEVPVETVRTRLKRGAARVGILLESGSEDEARKTRALLLTLVSPTPLAVATGVGAGVGVLIMKKTVVAVALLIFLGAVAGGVWHVSRPKQGPAEPPPPAAADADADVEEATLVGRGKVEPEPAPVAATPEPKTTGYRFVVTVVDDESERPVEGARVTLCHEFARREGEPHATTDEDGRVRVDLAKRHDGNCCLIQCAGYAPHIEPLYAHLRDVSEGAEVEIGPLRLIRGSSVRGEVLTRDGRAVVPEAELFLSCHRSMGSFGFAHREMKRVADAAGRFVLENVRPCPVGTWWLYAVSPTSIGWTELPASVGRSDLEGVEVRLQPTATVVVKVVGEEDGAPLPNALVQAQPHFMPLRTDAHGQPPRWFMGFRTSDRTQALFEGRTDVEGSRIFETVPVPGDGAATYRASASADGYVPTLSAAFPLVEGQRHEVTIALKRATTVALEGIVTTHDGAPIEGARILLNQQKKAATDEQGRFSIPGVDRRHGWAAVAVEAEGYSKNYRRQPIPSTGEVEEIRIVLWPVAPIAGRVVDQDGVPVEGVYVDLIRSGDVSGHSPVYTDADGRFRLPEATEHEYNLRVFPPQPYWAWLRPDDGYRVVRGGQMDLVLELVRAPEGVARVTAVVRDAATGAPLDPSEAMLVYGKEHQGLQSRPPRIESGRVVAEGVHPGTHVLFVRVLDRPAAYVVLSITETDREVSVAIDVLDAETLGTLRGRVEFGDETPPRGLFVQTALDVIWSRPQWVNSAAGRADQFARVAAAGTFELKGLLPGRTRVKVVATGWKGSETVDVVAGETIEVVVRAQRAGTIQFKLASPVPDGTKTVRFSISQDGETWDLVMNLGVRVGGKADHASTVEAGRWHWKVEFDPDNIAGGSRRSAETQTGTIQVARGEKVTVEVPVSPRGP